MNQTITLEIKLEFIDSHEELPEPGRLLLFKYTDTRPPWYQFGVYRRGEWLAPNERWCMPPNFWSYADAPLRLRRGHDAAKTSKELGTQIDEGSPSI